MIGFQILNDGYFVYSFIMSKVEVKEYNFFVTGKMKIATTTISKDHLNINEFTYN